MNPFGVHRLRSTVGLRSIRGDYKEVEYVHLNTVRAGLVKRFEDWQWSSVDDYSGGMNTVVSESRIAAIGRALLPADERART